VLEVWATHETSDEKRKYCLEKGYTFAEFHAPHVVEMHEKTQKGGTYKLENLKIREFECQQCECARKQHEIRLEKARLQKEAADEQTRVCKAADEQARLAALQKTRLQKEAVDEQVRLTALLVQEQQRRRRQVDREFYETSTGAETRIIELQDELHTTCMSNMRMYTSFIRDCPRTPYDLSLWRTRSIVGDLHAHIDLVYDSDAFRGFFDYAIEYRVRTMFHKKRFLALFTESQQQHNRQLVLQKEHMRALQKRKIPRQDNIRNILKPKAQTNTLAQHFKKTVANA